MDFADVAPPKLGWENDITTFDAFSGNSRPQRTTEVVGVIAEDPPAEKKVGPTRSAQWIEQELPVSTDAKGALELLRVRRKRSENPVERVVIGEAGPRLKRTLLDEATTALQNTHIREEKSSQTQYSEDQHVKPTRSVYRRVGTLPAIRILGVKSPEQVAQDEYEANARKLESDLSAKGITKQDFDSAHAVLVRERFLGSGGASTVATDEISTPTTSTTSIHFIDALPAQQVSRLRQNTLAAKDNRSGRSCATTPAGALDDSNGNERSAYSLVYQQMETAEERRRAKDFAQAEARRVRRAQARLRDPTLPEDADEDEEKSEDEDEDQDEATKLRNMLKKLASKTAHPGTKSSTRIGASATRSSSGLALDSYTNQFFARKRVESRTLDEPNSSFENPRRQHHQPKQSHSGPYADPTRESALLKSRKHGWSEDQMSSADQDKVMETKSGQQQEDGEEGEEEEVYDVYALVHEDASSGSGMNPLVGISDAPLSNGFSAGGDEVGPVTVTVLNSEEVEALLQRHNNWVYENDAEESDPDAYDDLDESESEIDYPDSDSSSDEDEDDDDADADNSDYDGPDDYYYGSKRGKGQRQKLSQPYNIGYVAAADDDDDDEEVYNNGVEDDMDTDEYHMQQDMFMYGNTSSSSGRRKVGAVGFDRFGRLRVEQGDSDFSKMSSWERAMASQYQQKQGYLNEEPLQHDFDDDDE